jgi:hypothetical protein
MICQQAIHKDLESMTALWTHAINLFLFLFFFVFLHEYCPSFHVSTVFSPPLSVNKTETCKNASQKQGGLSASDQHTTTKFHSARPHAADGHGRAGQLVAKLKETWSNILNSMMVKEVFYD